MFYSYECMSLYIDQNEIYYANHYVEPRPEEFVKKVTAELLSNPPQYRQELWITLNEGNVKRGTVMHKSSKPRIESLITCIIKEKNVIRSFITNGEGRHRIDGRMYFFYEGVLYATSEKYRLGKLVQINEVYLHLPPIGGFKINTKIFQEQNPIAIIDKIDGDLRDLNHLLQVVGESQDEVGGLQD
jgi:hypothetical protein